MTRDIEWGVPVPRAGYDAKRVYVWFEAVIGYLSATKALSRQCETLDWRDFWEDSSAESYYFQGKDNVPFHTVLWPAMLKGYGGLNLPTDVVANEFLNLAGDGFSSSRNWAVWLPDYLSRYEPDPLRYYLASIMPESSDSDFTWDGFLASNNNELVATFGNFVHRTLSMTVRNFDGRVPAPGDLDDVDRETLVQCDLVLEKVGSSIDARHFRRALYEAMELARVGNRYLDAKQPWTTRRTDLARTATTLNVALEVIATLRTVWYPFLPFSSEKLHFALGFDGAVLSDGWARRNVEPGRSLPAPVPLFQKLDPSIVEDEKARLEVQLNSR